MALIWKKNYTTGVERLDEQHRHIFDLFNRLESDIEADTCRPSVIATALREIGAELVNHFSCEEDCMARFDCPMARKNQQEHEQLLRLYLDFSEAYRKQRSLTRLKAFHHEAEQWLLEHICFVDIHLRSCVGPDGR